MKSAKKMQWFDVQQNTEEWSAMRCGKVTASNFSCFMANDGRAFGDPAKKYALQVALERVTGIKSDSGFSNSHTERGHEQEPIARMMYEDQFFIDVGNGGFFDCGYYGDSPDGLVCDDGVIEIKSVTPAVHYATMKRGSFDPAYKWQLAGHLDCTGRDWVDFVSYCAEFPEHNQLIVYRTYMHDMQDQIEALRARRSEFLRLIEEIQSDIQTTTINY